MIGEHTSAHGYVGLEVRICPFEGVQAIIQTKIGLFGRLELKGFGADDGIRKVEVTVHTSRYTFWINPATASPMDGGIVVVADYTKRLIGAAFADRS